MVGFCLRGGQYSFVSHGFDHANTNGPAGHLTAPATDQSVVGDGNGLYAYTSNHGANAPFPTSSWEGSDYLVSPRFVPAS